MTGISGNVYEMVASHCSTVLVNSLFARGVASLKIDLLSVANSNPALFVPLLDGEDHEGLHR